MRDEMAEMGSIAPDANLPTNGDSGAESDQGEDFDDFEAGNGDADFGDFDDGFQEPSLFADRLTDTHEVASTERVMSPSPPAYVSKPTAEITFCVHWLPNTSHMVLDCS